MGTGKRIRRITKPSSLELETVASIKCGDSASIDCRRRVIRSYNSCISRSCNALALDYDGTLVSLLNRTGKLAPAVVKAVGNYLDNEIPVMVISGRGDSLLKVRNQLSGFTLNSFYLAMYDGSKIVHGQSGRTISTGTRLSDSLRQIYHRLCSIKEIRKLASSITLKTYCIQIRPREFSPLRLESICRKLNMILPNGFVARSSGYTVDVYPVSRMKERCLGLLCKVLRTPLDFVRIGDQGHDLGNDYELLSDAGGFSVGTVSASERNCFPVVNQQGDRLLSVKGLTYLLTQSFRLS